MIFRGIFQQTSVELRSGITHKSIIFLSKMPLECFTILRHKLKKPNPSFFQGIRLLFYVPEVIRTPDLPVRYQPYVSKIKLDKRHFSGTPLRVISRRGEFRWKVDCSPLLTRKTIYPVLLYLLLQHHISFLNFVILLHAYLI